MLPQSFSQEDFHSTISKEYECNFTDDANLFILFLSNDSIDWSVNHYSLDNETNTWSFNNSSSNYAKKSFAIEEMFEMMEEIAPYEDEEASERTINYSPITSQFNPSPHEPEEWTNARGLADFFSSIIPPINNNYIELDPFQVPPSSGTGRRYSAPNRYMATWIVQDEQLGNPIQIDMPEGFRSFNHNPRSFLLPHDVPENAIGYCIYDGSRLHGIYNMERQNITREEDRVSISYTTAHLPYNPRYSFIERAEWVIDDGSVMPVSSISESLPSNAIGYRVYRRDILISESVRENPNGIWRTVRNEEQQIVNQASNFTRQENGRTIPIFAAERTYTRNATVNAQGNIQETLTPDTYTWITPTGEVTARMEENERVPEGTTGYRIYRDNHIAEEYARTPDGWRRDN